MHAYEARAEGRIPTMCWGGRKEEKRERHARKPLLHRVGEVEAARRVFGAGNVPPISSTKSMTGHAQGAAGALEAIFCLLMLDNDFITPSINVDTLAEGIEEGEVATQYVENAGLDSVMTNSFGFGGTNGSMVLSKYKD